MNAGWGSCSVTTNVEVSGALKALFGHAPPWATCGSTTIAWKESSTSAEVSGLPFENLSPSRRWKVKVLESGEISQACAAAPSRPVASLLLRTSGRLTSGQAQMVGLLL